MKHLKLILPFPKDWEPDFKDESALPEIVQSALPIAKKHIPDCLIPDNSLNSNAFIFDLSDVDEVEKAFLIHLGAIGGYGFIEAVEDSRDIARWICAVSGTEAVVVRRTNSWAL